MREKNLPKSLLLNVKKGITIKIEPEYIQIMPQFESDYYKKATERWENTFLLQGCNLQ